MDGELSQEIAQFFNGWMIGENLNGLQFSFSMYFHILKQHVEVIFLA